MDEDAARHVPAPVAARMSHDHDPTGCGGPSEQDPEPSKSGVHDLLEDGRAKKWSPFRSWTRAWSASGSFPPCPRLQRAKSGGMPAISLNCFPVTSQVSKVYRCCTMTVTRTLDGCLRPSAPLGSVGVALWSAPSWRDEVIPLANVPP
jgi:hypothetical protein